MASYTSTVGIVVVVITYRMYGVMQGFIMNSRVCIPEAPSMNGIPTLCPKVYE